MAVLVLVLLRALIIVPLRIFSGETFRKISLRILLFSPAWPVFVWFQPKTVLYFYESHYVRSKIRIMGGILCLYPTGISHIAIRPHLRQSADTGEEVVSHPDWAPSRSWRWWCRWPGPGRPEWRDWGPPRSPVSAGRCRRPPPAGFFCWQNCCNSHSRLSSRPGSLSFYHEIPGRPSK